MTTKIDISYYGNDFFYSEAEKNNKMPSKERCDTLNPNDASWDNKCNTNNFSNNLQDCIDKELCINKTNFESNNKIISLQNTSYEKYLNTKEYYNKEVLKTINLGVGIVFLIGLSYYFRVPKI
uniref:Uncharacterized protein n=1 Tax=viral metagenome TaxID=1070528 RepID=A0A6C0E9H0_9ZZZZ